MRKNENTVIFRRRLQKAWMKWKGRIRTILLSQAAQLLISLTLNMNTDNLKTLSIYLLLLKSKPTPFKGDGMKDPSAE
jgi:hypothetical protein